MRNEERLGGVEIHEPHTRDADDPELREGGGCGDKDRERDGECRDARQHKTHGKRGQISIFSFF
jgi:hypothetical protein